MIKKRYDERKIIIDLFNAEKWRWEKEGYKFLKQSRLNNNKHALDAGMDCLSIAKEIELLKLHILNKVDEFYDRRNRANIVCADARQQ